MRGEWPSALKGFLMERLQKILARAGVASRRKCEAYIVEGRVAVDGVPVTTLGAKADPDKQTITVDSQRIRLPRRICIALNKPKGYECTDYPDVAPKRVCDLVEGDYGRLFTIGRLDKDSEGLVLMTNDGDLANRLAHPRYGVPKTYRVVVEGSVTTEEMERLAGGIWLSDGKTRPCRIRKTHSGRNLTSLDVTLQQGINRQIRRMFARVGKRVKSLKRTREGPVKLDNLKPKRFRVLRAQELAALYDYAAAHKSQPTRKRGRTG